jgi:hypothetical protein
MCVCGMLPSWQFSKGWLYEWLVLLDVRKLWVIDIAGLWPVEHREMMQAYKRMEEKLQNFMEDQNAIESSYKDLKVNLCSPKP